MREITLYTDGGVRRWGKPNTVSAFSYYIIDKEETILYGKVAPGITGNQAEMFGVLYGVQEVLDRYGADVSINIISDSAYIVDTYNLKRIDMWKINGWVASNQEPVKNKLIWQTLDKHIKQFKECKFTKVKGHSGDYGNERVDTHLNEIMDMYDGRELID